MKYFNILNILFVVFLIHNYVYSDHIGEIAHFFDDKNRAAQGKVIGVSNDNGTKILKLECDNEDIKIPLQKVTFPNTALVIIDMQDWFINDVSNKDEILKNTIKHIEKAKERGQKIIFVEYIKLKLSEDSNGNLYPAATNEALFLAVKGYEHFTVIRKSQIDGALDIYNGTRKLGWEIKKIKICGVNTNQCVLATVMSLPENFKALKVSLLADACGTCFGYEAGFRALHLMSEMPFLRLKDPLNVIKNAYESGRYVMEKEGFKLISPDNYKALIAFALPMFELSEESSWKFATNLFLILIENGIALSLAEKLALNLFSSDYLKKREHGQAIFKALLLQEKAALAAEEAAILACSSSDFLRRMCGVSLFLDFIEKNLSFESALTTSTMFFKSNDERRWDMGIRLFNALYEKPEFSKRALLALTDLLLSREEDKYIYREKFILDIANKSLESEDMEIQECAIKLLNLLLENGFLFNKSYIYEKILKSSNNKVQEFGLLLKIKISKLALNNATKFIYEEDVLAELKMILEDCQVSRKKHDEKIKFIQKYESDPKHFKYAEFFKEFLGDSPCFEPEELEESMRKFVDKYYSFLSGTFCL